MHSASIHSEKCHPFLLLLAKAPHPEQLGPRTGSWESLDFISSKDLANQLTEHDWNLFKSIHQVRKFYGHSICLPTRIDAPNLAMNYSPILVGIEPRFLLLCV